MVYFKVVKKCNLIRGIFMNIKEKLNLGILDMYDYGPINIVAFGDSVTHGAVNNYNDYENVYWNLLKKKLNAVRDSIPVNVINAGLGGTTAGRSIPRLQRDVLCHHPDLVIVCFGLNDANGPVEIYVESLKEIFTKCQEIGTDIIYLTPNMLNTYVDDSVPEGLIAYATKMAGFQNSGKMDSLICAGIELANSMGVTVCDSYHEWKKLEERGVDTTALLANRINHPVPEMHNLFADMLFDIIMGNEEFEAKDYANTMYHG